MRKVTKLPHRKRNRCKRDNAKRNAKYRRRRSKRPSY